MRSDESAPSSSTVPPPHVIALPIALYELNGLIYELYQGGQPGQAIVIRWERLKKFTVTRKDNAAAEVLIKQGGRQLTSDQQQ